MGSMESVRSARSVGPEESMKSVDSVRLVGSVEVGGINRNAEIGGIIGIDEVGGVGEIGRITEVGGINRNAEIGGIGVIGILVNGALQAFSDSTTLGPFVVDYEDKYQLWSKVAYQDWTDECKT